MIITEELILTVKNTDILQSAVDSLAQISVCVELYSRDINK